MSSPSPGETPVSKETQALRDCLLETIEESLQAQLKAVKRLRHSSIADLEETARAQRGSARSSKKGMSQVNMAMHILEADATPLHISVLLQRIEAHFGRRVDRESLVSALSKRVARQDRLIRTARNTFSLRP